MKKFVTLSLTSVALAFLSGCASTHPMGILVTDVQLPVAVTANAANLKVGKSHCKTVLGLVAQGDASIEAAKKNGGITKVAAVDWKAKNILGLIGEYECIVYGE